MEMFTNFEILRSIPRLVFCLKCANLFSIWKSKKYFEYISIDFNSITKKAVSQYCLVQEIGITNSIIFNKITFQVCFSVS